MNATHREDWLHGWRRDSNSVLMGTCSYCIGCGREVSGPICVVIPPDWVPPPEPNWPFNKSDCPVCDGHYTEEYMEISAKEITAEAMSNMSWELLRKAIQIKKNKVLELYEEKFAVCEHGFFHGQCDQECFNE